MAKASNTNAPTQFIETKLDNMPIVALGKVIMMQRLSNRSAKDGNA